MGYARLGMVNKAPGVVLERGRELEGYRRGLIRGCVCPLCFALRECPASGVCSTSSPNGPSAMGTGVNGLGWAIRDPSVVGHISSWGTWGAACVLVERAIYRWRRGRNFVMLLRCIMLKMWILM